MTWMTLQVSCKSNLVRILLKSCIFVRKMILFLQDIYKILANHARIKILQAKFLSCKNLTSCSENGPFCARLLQSLARHFLLGIVCLRMCNTMYYDGLYCLCFHTGVSFSVKIVDST